MFFVLTIFRFPFTVNEIFSCELNSILEKFFEAPAPPAVEEKAEDKKEQAADKKDEDEDKEDSKEDFFDTKESEDDDLTKTEDTPQDKTPQTDEDAEKT